MKEARWDASKADSNLNGKERGRQWTFARILGHLRLSSEAAKPQLPGQKHEIWQRYLARRELSSAKTWHKDLWQAVLESIFLLCAILGIQPGVFMDDC